MALVLADRVKETSTTTGTGTFSLSGASNGFESFVTGVGNGNTTYYAIVNSSLNEWEVGLGTVTDATPDTLARTTVLASSNADAAVNFGSGTKDVFCTYPASKSVYKDSSGNIVGLGTIATQNASSVAITGGSINGTTVGATTASTGAFTTLTAPVPEASNGIYVNSQTIAASYTIASGYSGMSAGPVTIASGQSVTVASGSRWSVV